MVSRSYKEFTPSHKAAPDPSCQRIGDVPPDERIEVSIYLKPRDSESAAAQGSGDPRADLASRRSAQHANDYKLLQEFAKDHGLSVVATEPAKRLIKLGGTAAQFQTAFQTKLAHYDDGKRTFRGRSGALNLPVELHPVVESVLGLDTRPVAQPRLVFLPAAQVSSSFLPNNVAQLYAFPTSVTGNGQCIALIELGGGFTPSDTTTAFSAMGLSPPTVVAVSVDGGTNTPTPDDGADGEVALDIQVAGGTAPGATIAVYFAPNTDAGFVDAITSAVHDTTNKPSVVSISWGSAESNWTQQAIQTMNTALQDASTVCRCSSRPVTICQRTASMTGKRMLISLHPVPGPSAVVAPPFRCPVRRSPMKLSGTTAVAVAAAESATCFPSRPFNRTRICRPA